ncbi:MAG: ChbG/HpnK family deacetylase [Thermofilum sp.]|nr:ChbG/HpnK family deacetylase [Thermofilum sp.]MCC6064562.1 ChbG/HpnK family deacetylase [Thermofilum sp.]
MRELWEYMGLAGKRVLIVHHDDLALFRAQNEAYRQLPYSTGSLLMVSPWVLDLVLNPKEGADLGVHLTLTSEWRHYRFRPLTCGSSLRDLQGYMWPTTREAWEHVKTEDAEAELRAQVELALKLGIDVTHIDTHMGTVLRPDIADVYLRLASELRVPALIPESLQIPHVPPQFRSELGKLLAKAKLPRFKLADTYGVKPEEKARFLKAFLTEAEPGVYHLIHHACLLTEESRDLPDIEVRFSDFRALSDPEVRKLMDERWELLTYREVRDALRKYMGNEPLYQTE